MPPRQHPGDNQPWDILHYADLPTAMVTGLGAHAPSYPIGERVPHLVRVPRSLTPTLLNMVIHSEHERDSRYIVPRFPYRYATPQEAEQYLAAYPEHAESYRAQVARPQTSDQRIKALEEQIAAQSAELERLRQQDAAASTHIDVAPVSPEVAAAVAEHIAQQQAVEPVKKRQRGGTLTSKDVAGATPPN